MRNPNGFYVCILFRENGTPFYVGKGRGTRWMWHERSARTGGISHKDRLIRGVLERRETIAKIKVAEGLSNVVAIEMEKFLIKKLGRETDGGPLINQTQGGDGCVEPDDELRYRMGNGMRGRKMFDETRAKMRLAKKGFKITAEARAIGSAKRTGQKRSEETKAKMRAAKIGKKQKPEHVLARTLKLRGKVRSAESRGKISAARLANPAISDIVKNSWRPGGPRRLKLEGKAL